MDTIERIPAAQWRHVPTNCNPADVASRGTGTAKLICFQLWWQGPTWLLSSSSEWPCNTDWKGKRDLIELKPAVHLALLPYEDFSERFSSYRIMHRVLTWCFRFICNCSKHSSDRDLSPDLALN